MRDRVSKLEREVVSQALKGLASDSTVSGHCVALAGHTLPACGHYQFAGCRAFGSSTPQVSTWLWLGCTDVRSMRNSACCLPLAFKEHHIGMSILQAGKRVLQRITSREEPEPLPFSNKYRVEALEADNRSGPDADLPRRTRLHMLSAGQASCVRTLAAGQAQAFTAKRLCSLPSPAHKV